MNLLFKYCFLVLLFFCSALLYGATDLVRETKKDSVLASVNGEPVTLLDVLLETGPEESRLAVMYSGERLYAKTYELRRVVVNNIIERKLVYHKFKENPFEIRKQDVENMIDRIALTMGDGTRESLRRNIRKMGITMIELRKRAAERIAVDVLIYDNCIRRVFITPREVYEAYQSNISEWSSPRQVSLQLIFIQRPKKGVPVTVSVETVAQKLKNADEVTFRKMAQKYSDGPNLAQGGDMGWSEEANLRPEFAAIKGKEAGFIAGPIETPEGWYFIRVAAVRQAEVLPYQKAAKKIEKRLKQNAIERQRKLYIDDLKREAVIKYYF